MELGRRCYFEGLCFPVADDDDRLLSETAFSYDSAFDQVWSHLVSHILSFLGYFCTNTRTSKSP